MSKLKPQSKFRFRHRNQNQNFDFDIEISTKLVEIRITFRQNFDFVDSKKTIFLETLVKNGDKKVSRYWTSEDINWVYFFQLLLLSIIL
jgi:hypothetical protein